jgi:hypothetical protein
MYQITTNHGTKTTNDHAIYTWALSMLHSMGDPNVVVLSHGINMVKAAPATYVVG